MLIWLNLAIPILAIIILLIFFQKKMVWWEYLCVFFIPLLVIIICKVVSVSSQINTTEYWNSYSLNANYYEYWETWVHRTCSRENCSGSGKNRTCTTEYYPCPYCDENYAYWELHDNIGNTFHIDQSTFERLCQLWGNRNFVKMNRSINFECGCGKNGDMYKTNFDNIFDHTVPTITKHIYKNKVKCSKSVFNFQEVQKDEIKQYGLYDYPKYDNDNPFQYNPILGSPDKIAADRLQKYNAQFGASKQVHMMILIFQNQPFQAALMQEAYWKGGNKNEFILCVGLKGNVITWTKIISWTDKEQLKVRAARKIKEMVNFDPIKVSDTLAAEVKKDFLRKHFRDFDYLSVEPSETAIMITFILTLLITIGISIFVVKDNIDLE